MTVNIDLDRLYYSPKNKLQKEIIYLAAFTHCYYVKWFNGQSFLKFKMHCATAIIVAKVIYH